MLESRSTLGHTEVSVSTLDTLASANDVSTVDLLKIDVEGFELQVLEGGAALLSEGRVRFILAECVLSPDTQQPHTSFFEIHDQLISYGYCCVAYYAEAFSLEDGCALGNVLYGLRAKLPKSAPGDVVNITPALTASA